MLLWRCIYIRASHFFSFPQIQDPPWKYVDLVHKNQFAFCKNEIELYLDPAKTYNGNRFYPKLCVIQENVAGLNYYLIQFCKVLKYSSSSKRWGRGSVKNSIQNILINVSKIEESKKMSKMIRKLLFSIFLKNLVETSKNKLWNDNFFVHFFINN